MNSLHLVLGDQLSEVISSLEGYNSEQGVILMCEVLEEVTYVKHHKKKIAFIFSAMRHFAEELKQRGYKIAYTKIEDPNNAGTFKGEVERLLENHNINKIIVTHPGEYRLLNDIKNWEAYFGMPVEIRPDTRFLCSTEEFANWVEGRKNLRMEHFYRSMRKKYSILLEDNKPVGGQWNYDAENRKPPKNRLQIPLPYIRPVDAITQTVLEIVAEKFGDHFGDLQPFYFAVTRDHALDALQNFIEQRLHYFGDYQDAMIEDEPWMYHSHLSFYLNNGLLLPLECVRAAEESYIKGLAPLNAVEGFIRQVIGWREYIRGIYWLKMPEYQEQNFLNAHRQLPDFYWTKNTKMNCVQQCISETEKNSYSHHIQRLMITGNLALLLGVNPKYVSEWFLSVYADAYEWVELPNVLGMASFADGGYLASKPYAAGGSYINKMSNYCGNCSYKVSQKNGHDACPFNFLYWDFFDRNRDALKSNYRIGMIYSTFDKMPEGKKQAIRNDSKRFYKDIDSGKIV
ncbi:MAG: cryptochrome/photolyase family protein [Gammaproteobacteria bacterium]|jgi:deoxyribodipyrimidine photolyase-related protein|nr:cryptochrome/photolyase family protein [Gammaproteobacteria bacterium]